MPADKRKKGCPNQSCAFHNEKRFQNVELNYCPKCGASLVFVCTKCFNEIEDLGPEHKICTHCEVESLEKTDKIKGGLLKIGHVAASAAVATGGAVVAKALPQVKKIIVDKGSKTLVEVVKHVIR